MKQRLEAIWNGAIQQTLRINAWHEDEDSGQIVLLLPEDEEDEQKRVVRRSGRR